MKKTWTNPEVMNIGIEETATWGISFYGWPCKWSTKSHGNGWYWGNGWKGNGWYCPGKNDDDDPVCGS